MTEGGERSMSSTWLRRQVGMVLSRERADAMFARARQPETQMRWRFSTDETAIGIAGAQAPSRPIGRVHIWWGRPTEAEAVLWLIEWDGAEPDAEPDVQAALAHLLPPAGQADEPKRSGALFTAMLRGWACRAKEHPHSLARLLTGYPLAALRERLGCDEQTAYWLQLYGVPGRQRWGRDVAAMAQDLGLDAARLGAFLERVIPLPNGRTASALNSDAAIQHVRSVSASSPEQSPNPAAVAARQDRLSQHV
jgi:hypothetical protein